MTARFTSWIFILGLLFFAALPANAAVSVLKIPGGGQVSLSAQRAVRDFDRGVVELSGDVKVVYNQQYISCDRAVVNERTQTLEAEGNLVISSLQAYIEGDRAILNYGNSTGVIQNGFVKSGQVIFEGSIVRKTGEQSYEAEGSQFTACTTCPTAWTFAGTKMSAEIGGYAHIKNPILYVANFPVLWLPYLIVPLKSERQTGLLIPTFDHSKEDGAVIGLRYFWAIDRSQDALFTLKNYSRRGVKGLLNYRYMLSETSEGELNFGGLHDSRFIKDPIFDSTPADRNSFRWFVNYDHRYDLPFDFSQKLKLNLVSDLFYLRDFYDEIAGRGDPALENRFSLTRNTESTHASMDIGYYVDLMKESPVTSNDNAVHRFPEFRFALTEQPVFGSGLLFNLNADYVNFARDGYAYDDAFRNANGDLEYDPARSQAGGGVFNPETDIMRTGERLDLIPEISYPFQIGKAIDILPSIQYRHTQYAFNVNVPAGTEYDVSPIRSYVRAQASARTRFSRIFEGEFEKDQNGIDIESRQTLYRHEIEPELSGASSQFLTQPKDHPFFQEAGQLPIFLDTEPISNADFGRYNRIQFDYNDRVTNYNAATFALTNRLIRKRWRNGQADYQQVASLRLAQSYDFSEAARNESPRLPWSDISSLLDFHFDHFDSNTLVRYYPYHRVSKLSSYFRVKDIENRNYFEIGYSKSLVITRSIADTRRDSEDLSFALGFNTRFVDTIAGVNFGPENIEKFDMPLKSFFTAFNFKPPGNCWGVGVQFEQRLGDELKTKFTFDYNFGGETRPTTTAAANNEFRN